MKDKELDDPSESLQTQDAVPGSSRTYTIWLMTCVRYWKSA